MTTNFLLDQINPLRGLDQAAVINQIDLGMRGNYARLQWLYFFVEKRDPIARAVKRRLLASLSGLDWNIKETEVGDDAPQKDLAGKQAQSLREAYDAITNLRSALTFLALADLRGFSHVEKIYARDGDDPWLVKELRIVEQWFWVRNGYYGDWQYNPEAKETNTGAPINLRDFVIHTVDDPVDEIFAELTTKKKVNDNDWDGFLEDYGVPPQFIEGPPNVPADKEAQYQLTAEQIISRKRGYFPNGSKLHTPSATGSGGAGVFSERLKYIDEQIVIAGTAGKLTVLSEAGSGTLAGSAQKEAFDEIAQAIANQIATRMHEQFDKPLLVRLYPNEPVLAYFEFAQINPKDTSDILDDAVKASSAGFRIDPEELSEKTGYELQFVGTGNGGQKTEGGGEKAAISDPSSVIGHPSSGAAQPALPDQSPVDAVAEQLRVTPEFVAPAKSVIDQLIAQAQDGTVSNEQLQASAEAFLKAVPELIVRADISGVAAALQAAMEESIRAAL